MSTNNQALHDFVKKARAKNVSDQEIITLLEREGWDKTEVHAAVLGLDVPSPVASSDGSKSKSAHSLSALEAALHHILLWVFSLAAAIVIGSVVNLLFGGASSSDEIASFLAVMSVTYIAYGVFYIRYLRRLRHDPLLATGHIWPIITIVIHSLGALSALITIVTLLLNNSEHRSMYLTTAAVIGVLDACVVAAYAAANFMEKQKVRMVILRAFPVVITVLLGVFSIVALLHLAPMKVDDQTQTKLMRAVEEVHNFTNDRGSLPDRLSQTAYKQGDVTYHVNTPDTYTVCANFKLQTTDQDLNDSYMADDYVDASMFSNHRKGLECFRFDAVALQQGPKVD